MLELASEVSNVFLRISTRLKPSKYHQTTRKWSQSVIFGTMTLGYVLLCKFDHFRLIILHAGSFCNDRGHARYVSRRTSCSAAITLRHSSLNINNMENSHMWGIYNEKGSSSRLLYQWVVHNALSFPVLLSNVVRTRFHLPEVLQPTEGIWNRYMTRLWSGSLDTTR